MARALLGCRVHTCVNAWISRATCVRRSANTARRVRALRFLNPGELVLMFLHPYPPSSKRHAFGLQAQALLQSGFARQPDLAASSEYAMPRQTACCPQRPHHLPRAAGESSRLRDIAIGCHFAFRNLANGVANDAQHAARYQASVRRSPCSKVYCGSCARSRRAAVVSAWESWTSPSRGAA